MFELQVFHNKINNIFKNSQRKHAVLILGILIIHKVEVFTLFSSDNEIYKVMGRVTINYKIPIAFI